MSDLQNEMDRYSLQDSLSGADNEETTTGSDGVTDSITDTVPTPPPPQEFDREDSYSPPPLPPPEHQPMMNLQKPSLPEPEGPPPPPPTQNGYAFPSVHYTPETQKAINTLKRQLSLLFRINWVYWGQGTFWRLDVSRHYIAKKKWHKAEKTYILHQNPL